MEPFKQRLLEESDELSDRLQHANAFMQTTKFSGLDVKDQQLLYNQTLAMELYLNILTDRIYRLLTPEERKEWLDKAIEGTKTAVER